MYFLIILLLVGSFNIINAQNTSFSIQNLFEMNKKLTPLYFCPKHSNGGLWNHPPPLKCSLLNLDNTKQVNITLWFDKFTQNSFKGFECYKVVITVKTTCSFWVDCYDENLINKFPITIRECKRLAYHRKSPSGDEVVDLSNGHYGTINIPSPPHPNGKTRTTSYINYIYTPVDISINDKNQQVSTSNFTENCFPREGSCAAENSIIIWDPSNIPNTCRLMKGESIACISTGTLDGSFHMACPAINVYFQSSLHMYITSCNCTIGYSSQGFLFTFDENSPYDSWCTTATFLQQAYNTSFASNNVTSSELTYIQHLIASPFATQKLFLDLCVAQQLELQLLTTLTAAGHTDLMIQTLMQDQRFRVISHGDVFSVYQCQSIHEYIFLPNNNCTTEWPISFFDNNYDLQFGYLKSPSHEIVLEPSPSTCPIPSYIFNTGTEFVHLTNKTILDTIEVLPIPGLGWTQKPTLSFAPSKYYAQDFYKNLTHQLISKSRIDNILTESTKGAKLNAAQLGVIGRLIDLIVKPIATFFVTIIKWIFIICFIIVLVKLIWMYKIWKFIMPCLKGFISLFKSKPKIVKPTPEIEHTTLTIHEVDPTIQNVSKHSTRSRNPSPSANPKYPAHELHELQKLL